MLQKLPPFTVMVEKWLKHYFLSGFALPGTGLGREGWLVPWYYKEGWVERHQSTEGISPASHSSTKLTVSLARVDVTLSGTASREVVKADVTSTQLTISLSSRLRFFT